MNLVFQQGWKVSFEKYFPLIYQALSAFHTTCWMLTNIVVMLICFSFMTSLHSSHLQVCWLFHISFIFTSVLNNAIWVGYFTFSNFKEHCLSRNTGNSLKQRASWQPEFATFRKLNRIRIFLFCSGRKESVVQKASYDTFSLKNIQVIPLEFAKSNRELRALGCSQVLGILGVPHAVLPRWSLGGVPKPAVEG